MEAYSHPYSHAGDAAAGSDANLASADRDANSDVDAASDIDSNATSSDRNSDENVHGDSHIASTDSNADLAAADRNTYANPNTYADADCDAHVSSPNADTDVNPDPHTDSHRDAHVASPNPDTDIDSNPHADTARDRNAHSGDRHPDADTYTDARVVGSAQSYWFRAGDWQRTRCSGGPVGKPGLRCLTGVRACHRRRDQTEHPRGTGRGGSGLLWVSSCRERDAGGGDKRRYGAQCGGRQ